MRDTVRDTVKAVRSQDMAAALQEEYATEYADETIDREDVEGDDSWVRSIGLNVLCTHYREQEGTRHAVCPPGSDICHIHEDKENAHTNPVSHVVKDAPELVVMAGVGLVFGPAAMKKALRFLP